MMRRLHRTLCNTRPCGSSLIEKMSASLGKPFQVVQPGCVLAGATLVQPQPDRWIKGCISHSHEHSMPGNGIESLYVSSCQIKL